MTRMHVAVLLACLAMPLLCGLSHTCSADSMKDVMQLSMAIGTGALGHAGQAARKSVKKKKKKKKAPAPAPKGPDVYA